MSKLKKFLLLIPTAFIMLLNCMSFTAFAIDDFSQYFKNPEDHPEILEAYDYTDYEKVFRDTFGDMPEKYLLYACADRTFSSYVAGYMTGGDDIFSIYCVDLTDVETDLSEYSLISTTPATIYKATYHLSDRKFYFDDNFAVADDLTYFKYFSETAHFDFRDTPYIHTGSLATQSRIDVYSFFIYTNHPDIHLPDFAGGSSGGALDVDVVFNPALSDTLDRSMISDDGSKYLRSNFSMHVYNHNKFPIQYTMVISSALLDVDNVFCYYSNDWVYSRSLDSYDDFYNDVVQKQQKSTFVHYVLSGRTDSVNFNFNQINLVEGGIYTVRVYAGRNDCGYGSEFVLSADDYASESYQINYSLVYESTFSVLQYDDVKYDPNNTSNGILPYNYGLSQKYNHSYNAVEKQDGEVDYTGKDVYSDNDSWYNHPIDDNSVSSSTSGTTSFSNFSKSFKNFFGFIKYMFNFLPKDVKTVFTLGFTGIMVIALVKVLFKS